MAIISKQQLTGGNSPLVLSEKKCQEILFKSIGRQIPNYKYMIPNCYTKSDNEADMLGIRNSLYCDEFEIKVSKQDFKNDAKKTITTWIKENGFSYRNKKIVESKEDYMLRGQLCNYFWYCVPENLVDVSEIPDYAGLIYITNNNCRVIKSPKKLHKEKLSDSDLINYLQKLYFRYWNLRK